MRHPRLPAWARPAACAAACTCAVAGLVPGAAAEEKFQKLVVFGDSYANVTIGHGADELPWAARVRIRLWRVYPVPLQQKLGIPVIEDIAVAGATASPTPECRNPS